MKQFFILILCSTISVHCQAQSAYIPNPAAKQINDKAVSTFLKYNTIPDSVVSVIQKLDNALNIDSNYYTAWNNKLSFLCQLGQYENALNTAQRIVRIFPDEHDIVFFSGILAFKIGHNDEAIAIFKRLIKFYNKVYDTNDDAGHLKTTELNKGIALKLIGEPDDSKKILVNLSMQERDLVVRRHINSYISKTKEEIINEMIAAK